MDKVINFGIPHVGEQIFGSLEILDLIQCWKVSKTWRSLSENVLVKRCKGRTLEMCALGLEEVVQILLEHPGGQDIDWNAKDFSGETILTLACQNGHLKVFNLLLDHSNAKNINLSSLQRCAMKACEYGHPAVVQKLLEHLGGQNIDWNAKDFSNSYFGDTVLTLACQNGHPEVVKLLLDHSNAKNIDLSCLEECVLKACKNSHPPVVLELLQHPEAQNIDLNAYEDTHGYTILMWACQMGHANIVKLLLDHAQFSSQPKPLFGFLSKLKSKPKNPHFGKIDLNQQGKSGYTGFMLACREGHENIVKLMLEHPNTKYIDKNLMYRPGRNAFGLICERGLSRGQFAIIPLLMQHSIDKGIDLNQKDMLGRTALESACCYFGNVDVVKCILENSHGTNLEIPTLAKLEVWQEVLKVDQKIKALFDDFWKNKMN